jgi:hypothetical protein
MSFTEDIERQFREVHELLEDAGDSRKANGHREIQTKVALARIESLKLQFAAHYAPEVLIPQAMRRRSTSATTARRTK